ncbi:Sushi, von Willebrand factor type A, EGF and pentraxin domain-containing protein 1 [Aphelenchoides fujianensis]|nr:Sushi, von Willebrand factor type A, EGF and pentraxin domain-containing protein 1 [Aphelenchoides fujianensis]
MRDRRPRSICNLGTTPAGPTTASCLGASGWSPPTLGPCNGGGAFGGIGGGIGAPGLGGIGGAGSCLAGILPPLNGRVTYSTGSPIGPYPSGTSATANLRHRHCGSTKMILDSSCFGLPTPANGRVSYSSFPNLAGAYPIATSAFVVCNLAFVPSNGQTIFSCLSNGWSSAPSSLASCVPSNNNGGR